MYIIRAGGPEEAPAAHPISTSLMWTATYTISAEGPEEAPTAHPICDQLVNINVYRKRCWPAGLERLVDHTPKEALRRAKSGLSGLMWAVDCFLLLRGEKGVMQGAGLTAMLALSPRPDSGGGGGCSSDEPSP
jgi:hypothetical protein